ncbi:hypothetical protein ACFSKL_00900 [Belliella marina]|uniref:Uncharacterized protein n=1 Tax=Belliella marina TaxID=1644146 RepID=A0ABW4VHQ5_9BACT
MDYRNDFPADIAEVGWVDFDIKFLQKGIRENRRNSWALIYLPQISQITAEVGWVDFDIRFLKKRDQ